MKSTKIGNFVIYYENSEEFHNIKREIWTNKIYHFKTESKNPIIIDLGAHIGISTLFFKHIYPEAKIVCVEPNPENIKLLELNIKENILTNVSILPFAILDKNDEVNFNIDSSNNSWFSTGSIIKGSWKHTQKTKNIKVKSININDLIDNVLTISKQIDLIKIDVEGSEYLVLERIENKYFVDIKKLIIEFHDINGSHYKKALKRLSEFYNINEYKVEKDLAIVETL